MAGRKCIVGFGDRQSDWQSAKIFPQLRVKRALDDADTLALDRLWRRQRFGREQMPRTVVHEGRGDDPLRSELHLQARSRVRGQGSVEVLYVAEQEGQIEQLGLRHPCGQVGERREACLDRTKSDSLHNLLLTPQ